jgi:radical SAM superfamily enzyme YgiQ (UPF0313 family)
MTLPRDITRVALIEAGSPGLNIYSHVAMGRGVPLLATVLGEVGYQAKAFVEDVSGRDTIDWDFVRDADVVGFSSITCTLPRTRRLIERTRELNPRAVVLLGGPEPTCAPERSLRLRPDFIVRGEAEDSLPRLLAVLSGRSDERLQDIPGLVWTEEGVERTGAPLAQLSRKALDALPLVDRSLIHEGERGTVVTGWRTRGCPLRCDFCEVHEIWPRYVSRSNEHSVEELISAQDAGAGSAFLIDDNAAADKSGFKDFLRTLGERGYARALTVQLRADSVLDRDGRLDRELLRLLKKAASVTLVCVGVESADDANLESLGKRIDSSRMARALKAMRRFGLLVHGMFIALPGDTAEVIKRNGTYARKYVTSLQYLFEVPLPGTKRTDSHERAGTLLFKRIQDLELFDGMHVVVRPEWMSPAEMQALVTREYRRFYSVWRVVMAALSGAFLRFRRLTSAQRDYLARLAPRRRLRAWLRFHVEYKFAPVAFLATGRRRVRAFMRDPDYARYLARLVGERPESLVR